MGEVVHELLQKKNEHNGGEMFVQAIQTLQTKLLLFIEFCISTFFLKEEVLPSATHPIPHPFNLFYFACLPIACNITNETSNAGHVKDNMSME